MARCLRQQPLPAWAVAARQCAPPPPPQTAFAQQALGHVGWQRPGGDVLLSSITVREFWQLELSAPQLRSVQRLRLGSPLLPVETGRFAKLNTGRTAAAHFVTVARSGTRSVC